MAEERNTNTDMLIELVKSVAVLTSEFKNFKNERSEDNAELKASIKEVKDDVKILKGEVDKVKAATANEKAAKWDSWVKLIFEVVATACLGTILIKLNLK